MGILALLDEECLFPKASDKTYVEKLHKNHDGKTQNFIKPSFKSKGTQVDFELAHYAGTVSNAHIVQEREDEGRREEERGRGGGRERERHGLSGILLLGWLHSHWMAGQEQRPSERLCH